MSVLHVKAPGLALLSSIRSKRLKVEMLLDRSLPGWVQL